MSSDNISVYEQYLFAKDKKEFLESCKNASQVKQYIRLCHLLNDPARPLEQVDKDVLLNWTLYQCNGDRFNLVLKNQLLDILAEADHEKRKPLLQAFNQKFLSYGFYDERQVSGNQAANSTVPGAKVELKTALAESDFSNMATAARVREVEDSTNGSIPFSLYDLGDTVIKRIDLDKVKHIPLLEQIFNSVDNFSYYQNIVSVLLKYKKYMRARDQYSVHWQIPENILQKCTLLQLDNLGDKDSDTNTEFYFRKVQFVKKFDDELRKLNEAETAKIQRQILLEILEKVKKDTSRNNDGIISALNEALLLNGYELEEYDETLFRSYIHKPSFRHNEVPQAFWDKVSNQSDSWKTLINYRPVNIPQPDNYKLYEAYLNKVLENADLIKEYSGWFNPHFINGIVLTNKALNGGDITDYKAHFGEARATELENKKNLEIIRSNKRTFKGKEPVSLTLLVKNVPELLYKVFEIDTETYYKRNKSEISDSLDLDGLIPEKSYKISYPQKKHHQHLEVFTFDDITNKEKGVFIIEFVGGGVSSRAVIRKGTLELLVQEHFQGFRLYIIDEEKRICNGTRTGIIVDGKFHKTNEKGYVLMPFGENYLSTQAILTHEGFNSLADLNLTTENYSLNAAVVFNEESIIAGRKLRIILKTKLYLNESLITLKKFEEFNAEIQLTNYEGITNYKHFKDIKLSDSEDYVLEFIVPPMLTRLEVRANGKLKNLLNKDVDVSFAETIAINRDENTDKFITCHLNHDAQGYYVELRGKNGENIPNRQIVIQFYKSFGSFNYPIEVYTNAQGVARIGNLDEVKWIFVRSNNNSFTPRTFVLATPGARSSVTSNYNVCQGDQLVLPSLGLPLEHKNISFVKLSAVDYTALEDCFSNIKEEKDNGLFVLDGLKRGSYSFTYLTNPSQTISVTVHDAKRWPSNPLFLELENQIMELKSESKYLSVSQVTKGPETVRLKISSNSLPNVRAHVLAYHHHSQMIPVLSQRTGDLCPTFGERSTIIQKKYNSYRSNRVLSDEHVYVNERKSKQTFIGNTLDKPSILLHREKVRETKDDEEVLNKGGDFGRDDFMKREMVGATAYATKCSAPSGGARGMSYSGGAAPEIPTSYVIVSNMDYFQESGRTWANLKPNAEGFIDIPTSDLKDYSYLLVNVSDNTGNVFFNTELTQSTPKKIDLRIAKAKEQGLVYSEDFFSITATATAPGVIQDQSNTSNYIVEDLSSLLDVLLVIAGGSVNKTELQKWKFLSTWNKLTEEEKFKKIDELGGHELHIFIFFRDRPFFDKFIGPMLRYKAKKQLIDYLLLGDASKYQDKLKAQEYNKINLLEGALLVYRLRESNPEECKNYLEGLRKRQEVKLENSEKKKALFESILASKKIDEPVEDTPVHAEEEYEEREVEICVERCLESNMPHMTESECYQENLCLMDECAAPEMMRMMPAGDDECDAIMPFSAALMDIEDKPSPIRIEKYQKKGAAFEFKERQEYFKGQFSQITLNKFWLKVVESILSKNHPLVLGDEIIEMNTSSLDLILCLTFSDLPFVRGSVDTKIEGGSLNITSTENLLIFCKRMEERKTDTLNMELVISQKFYDPEDKFIYDEKDPTIFTIKEVREFLTAKIYEARIAFTNIGDSACSVKLITQIPAGAMPVNRLEFFKIHDVQIEPMTAQVRIFKFYFPSVGTFKYFPATIMKNNRFVTAARYTGDLNVVSEYSKDNKVLETLQDILNYGTIDDILNFMAQKNIFNDKIFNIGKVRWIFKSSPENFKRAIDILRQRYLFDAQAWAYSILHGNVEEFLELLRIRVPDILQDCQYLKIWNLEVDRFEPLEYDPLINPRAHDISDKKHNILNKAFKETYERFLKYCVERGNLSQREKTILVAYLVLQDRIQDALEKIKEIDEAEVKKDSILLVQYEYLKAYLSIYTDTASNYAVAREVAAKYNSFPDLTWRKRFREIQKQLVEHDKGMIEKAPEEKKGGVQEKTNLELADKSEYLALELKENFQLAITHKNISQLTISFYKLEMEILFSNDPFLEKDIMNFVSVNPNHLMKFRVQRSSEFKTNIIVIPEALQKDSLFIQVKGKDRFEIVKSFNSHLRVHTVEEYGLLNVSDLKGKCLNSVYVKCFSKKKDGTVKFYKDGYTDFRGSFDFASLNSDSLNDIEKFGMFVFSQEHGSVILTAKPPSQVGRIVKDDDNLQKEEAEEIDEEFATAPLLS
jgi:hypothetical protein